MLPCYDRCGYAVVTSTVRRSRARRAGEQEYSQVGARTTAHGPPADAGPHQERVVAKLIELAEYGKHRIRLVFRVDVVWIVWDIHRALPSHRILNTGDNGAEVRITGLGTTGTPYHDTKEGQASSQKR